MEHEHVQEASAPVLICLVTICGWVVKTETRGGIKLENDRFVLLTRRNIPISIHIRVTQLGFHKTRMWTEYVEIWCMKQYHNETDVYLL